MTPADRPALATILQDPIAMTAYEGAFDEHMVDGWLERTLARYGSDGYALWAVTTHDSDEMIGQCGITNQHILGADVLEVGYLFRRSVWHQGYATEAAAACRDYAFEVLGADRVWAQVRDTNLASMNVAIRLGMTVRGRFVREYRGVSMPHLAFAVDRPASPARGRYSR